MPLPVPATIVRSRRRTISLEITPDAALVVRVPLRTPESYIAGFITEKQDWIEKKMAEVRSRPVAGKKQFVNGEPFLFLGTVYPLVVLPGSDAPVSLGKSFFIGERCLPHAREFFRAWYVEKADVIVPARVAGFAAILDYRPKKIRISDTRRRWASCSTSGTLSFCWRLILAPPEVIDYVIVHELVHMRQPDHSPRFWEKVQEAMPEYRRHREWLRSNERLLAI
ncbi:MAG: M48 family metallopeptidase [Methanoregula sp.]|nr:M48 family metallopeptidase [Methanoregula sp.]